MTPPKQSLRTYLLHAAFSVLIGAAMLPLLQAIAPQLMAEAGFEPAHPAILAIAGGWLGGGFYTAAKWIDHLAVREGWMNMSTLERRMHKMDRRVSVFLALMISLFLFAPIYLVALVQHWRA